MASFISTHAQQVERSVRAGQWPDDDPNNQRLLASWRRSLENYQLDPGRAAQPRILTGPELRDHQEAMESFLRIARRGVRKLHEQVREASYVVLLTDPAGVTIDFLGNPTLDKDLKRAGLYLGSCWSEQEEGTCGVGTSLVDRCPITVHKGEHFRAPNTTLTCSSAPVFDTDGNVLAILDASALYSPDDRKSQILALQFVAQSAAMIENAYFLDRFQDHWVLQLSASREFLQIETDYLVAFDDNGRVLAANQRARTDLFPANGGTSRIEDLFLIEADALIRLGQTPGLVVPLQLARGAATYHGQVRAPVAERPMSRPTARTVAAASMAPAVLPVDVVAGNEPSMRENARRTRRILDAQIPILLLGETGTGKEAFAKAIHQSSRRAARPFVPINCAAIPESLIESELFGYVEGAFTGARTKGMRGKILEADGGTLFLDEIGDMPVALQTRLLRVLAENEVQPLGGGATVPVNLHVICATHQDLEQRVREGRFRQDLFFRLAGATFHLPPLRQRADAGLLIEALLAEEAAAVGKNLRLHADGLHALLRYRWPGNIRELRNTMRYAVHVAQSDVVRTDDLPVHIVAPTETPAAVAISVGVQTSGISSRTSPLAGERDRIVGALRSHRWHVSAAARTLGISRATLYRRMEAHGIVPPNQIDSDDPEG